MRLILIGIILLIGCKSYKVVIDGKPNYLASDPTVYKSDKYYCVYNTFKNGKVCLAQSFSSNLKDWIYDSIVIEPDQGSTGVETADYVKVGDSERIYYVQWQPEYCIHWAERINGVWEKRGEILRGVEPWEVIGGKSFIGDIAVLYNGRWHMWYQSGGSLSPTPEITHVESEDGIKWTNKYRFTRKSPAGHVGPLHPDVSYNGGYHWVGWLSNPPGLYRTFSASPLDDFTKWEVVLLEKDSFKGQECHSTGLFAPTEIEGKVFFTGVSSSAKDPCADKGQNKAIICIK